MQPQEGLPGFLFFQLSAQELEQHTRDDDLVAPELRLYEDESDVPGGTEPIGVLEASRATRSGVRFEALESGVFRVDSIPLRYVLSSHSRYVRQVSAGGVLARGRGEAAEFALMRTLPRKEAVARKREEESAELPAEIQDPREEGDRRATDRRQSQGAPPSGKERRRGRSRRMRRRRRSSRWGPDGRLELPKGKVEPGETVEQAAVREVREELGFTSPIEVGGHLSKNHYTFRTPDGKAIFKTVHYYLLTTTDAEPSFTPRAEEGVISVEWWAAQRAIQQVAFPNLKPVLERAWELLQE